MDGRYLLFHSGDLSLAVPLEKVRELVGPEHFSDAVRGESGATVRVGARRLPVVDGRFDVCAAKPAEALLLVEEKGLTAGIFVDRIAGIREGNSLREHPFPSMLVRFRGRYSGLLEAEENLFLLLDLACVGEALNPGRDREEGAEEEGA